MESELNKRLKQIINNNLSDDFPATLGVEIKDLVRQGFTELNVRKCLKQDFGMYIDDYGILRGIIPNN